MPRIGNDNFSYDYITNLEVPREWKTKKLANFTDPSRITHVSSKDKDKMKLFLVKIIVSYVLIIVFMCDILCLSEHGTKLSLLEILLLLH